MKTIILFITGLLISSLSISSQAQFISGYNQCTSVLMASESKKEKEEEEEPDCD